MLQPVKGGQFLRNKRKDRGMTIEDVTRDIGVEVSDISRIETGRLASPGLYKIITYAKYLGVTPNQICEVYGIWDEPAGGEADDKVAAVSRDLRSLPAEERNKILDVCSALITQAQKKK